MAYRDEPPASTKNRFSERMAGLPEEELVAVIEGRPEDWEPDAIAAARSELARRRLSFEEREALSVAFEKANARKSDPWVVFAKRAAFVSAVFLVTWLARHM